MVSMWSLPRNEQIFSWQDPSSGKVLHFAATSLLSEIKDKKELVRFSEIDLKFIETIVKKRGIESHRLTRLTDEQLQEPVLVLDYEDGHLMIDGHHRLLCRHLKGMTTFLFFLVPKEIWEKFQITDIPKELDHKLLGGFSGIR